MDKNEIKYKSLQKSIMILNCFTQKTKLGVTEISELLGFNKSNVHDILTTFKALDYLEQDEETGKYMLGRAIFALCRALGDSFSITKIAMPFMQEISNQTGERVYIAVPSGDEVLYLEATYPTEAFNLMRSLMGEKAKMYCTGIGKAMMAYLPKDMQEEYLNQELKAFTEYTITDPEKLREEFINIRRKGYAIDNMEHEFGIKCVAVPVFSADRKVCAAISVSGPSPRFEGEEKIEEIVKIVKEYVDEIEKRI